MSHFDIPTNSLRYVTKYDLAEFKKLRTRMYVRAAFAFIGSIGFIVMMMTTLGAGTFGGFTSLFVYGSLGAVVMYTVVQFYSASGQFQPVNRARYRTNDAYRFFKELSRTTLKQPKRASFAMHILAEGQYLQVTLSPVDGSTAPQRYILAPTYFGTVGAGPSLDIVLPGLKHMFQRPDNFGDYNEIILGTFKDPSQTSVDEPVHTR